jgi:hypothetical protein
MGLVFRRTFRSGAIIMVVGKRAYAWIPIRDMGSYPQRDQTQWGRYAQGQDTWDPALRSTHDVTGHHLQATDGKIGHAVDFVIDPATWAIRYWSGSWNVDRVREWRAANPEYWKRTGRKSERPLQNAMKPTEVTAPPMNKPESSGACVTRRVPALLQAQSPVVLGLIAQITGSALQDAILEVTTRLFENGQAVLGISAPGKNEERAKQTNPQRPAAAAATAKIKSKSLQMRN